MRPTVDNEAEPDDIETTENPHEFAEESPGPREPRQEVPPPELAAPAEEPVPDQVDEDKLHRMRTTQP